MRRMPDELRLDETYAVDVSIESNGNNFAGELSLSPNECTLVIRGDLFEGRSPDLGWEDVDTMTCRGFDGTFYLYGLTLLAWGTRTLQRHPKVVGHFETRYRVSHVIYGRTHERELPPAFHVSVHSPSIAQWVGTTRVQDKIVAKYQSGTLFGNGSTPDIEFLQPISGLGAISIGYAPSTQYSSEKFSMALKFAPVLGISFETPKDGAEAIHILSEVIALFSFLIGSHVVIDAINLVCRSSSYRPLSVYFARPQQDVERGDYPFFPLGANLRLDHLGLPELPLGVFERYFSIEDGERQLFFKYIRYRGLQNPEEQFLGFFRLLEKLCFQQESFLPEEKLTNLLVRAKPFFDRYFGDGRNVTKFLGQVERWNKSKLNTAGCIAKFLKTLPSSLRERWNFGSNDIQGICKLRNDLTHANTTEPDSHDVACKAKFIEALLVARLLIFLGVSADSAAVVLPRLRGHHLAERRQELDVSVRTEVASK